MSNRLGLYELSYKEGVTLEKIIEAIEMFLKHTPKVIEYYAEIGFPAISIENLPEAMFGVVYFLGTRVIPLILAYFVLP